MFCGNCGNKINTDEKFCSNCGTQIINQKNSYAKNIANYFFIIVNNVKNFVLKFKKQVIACMICLILIIGGVIAFNKFYDFTKISWDETTQDSKVSFTEPTTLSLSVLAYDKEKKRINNIKFTCTDGEIETTGNNVEWKLPNKNGIYTITATAPSGKKITKKVEVISFDENTNLSGVIDDEINNETTDNDNDGLTNAKEKELDTNINLGDTDRDGISDYYEINNTKTDPLKIDSDDDGINDGDELDLDLNPLNSDSKGDGIKDGDRNLSYVVTNDELGVTLTINGKGNISSSTIDIFENNTFNDMDGLLNEVYNFNTSGTIESATVKIKYNSNLLEEKNLDENNLTLYYFNEETKELEAMPTIVDKENKLITVTLNHFSKYVIGDKSAILTNINSEIMFVIDNSVSMYSESQMIDAGYNESTGATGNDTSFKRLTLTNNLIDMFTGNYKFGVAEFSGNYINLLDFSDDKKSVKSSVNSMKSNWESNANGTNIVDALKNGINEFNMDNNNHYLILLTDGKNTEGSLSYNKSTIIDNAKQKNVKVCVIGLGSDIDTDELSEIALSTGCGYYNASDAAALDEIYSLVGANINYNYVDTDGDNIVDGMITANSGFIVNRDGFSFVNNFSTNKSIQGHCYGMATFAMLYYTKKLPMSLGYADKHTIFKNFKPSDGYNLHNTYFETYQNLYDFRPDSKILNYYLYDIPSDYRDRIENNTWMLKEEYYNEYEKIGATIITKDYKKKDSDFNKYQSAILNIDDEKFESNVSKSDSQMFSAIWRLFILQVDDRRTSFQSDPDRAFEELKSNLSTGNPIVSVIPGHAINSIKLIQDINDANKFKIEVYDNNYPGETRYIEVTRSKYSKWQFDITAWTNEYEYSFKYDKNNDGILEEINTFQLAYPNVNE